MAQEYDIPQDFFEKNSKFWPVVPKSGKYMLVDLLTADHEYWNVTLISARMFVKIFQLEPVALIKSRQDKQLIKLADSYGLKEKVFLEDYKVSFARQAWLLFCSGWHWLWTRTKQRRLDFKYKGFTIGHYIYDTYLNSRGFGTVKLFDLRYGRLTWWALRQFYQYLQIFSQRKYEIYFGSEQAYMIGGIPSAVAILKGAEVCYRQFSPTRVSYRFYRKAADLDIYTGHPDHAKFQAILNNPAEFQKALVWADQYLKNMFSGQVEISDWNITNAYAQARALPADEYQAIFGGSHKKIVFIFCHILTDAAHGYRQGLFADYEIWLRETLKAAVLRPEVLWILKPHPSEKYYFMRTSITSIYQDFAGYPNIKLFPASASAVAYVDKIDAVLTVRGTAAVEYASMGLFVVTAGRNMFDQDGFEAIPASVKDYKRILLTSEFPRLSTQVQQRAKVSLYTYNYWNLTDLPLLHDLKSDPTSRLTPKAIYDHLTEVFSQKSYDSLLTKEYQDYVLRKYNENLT